jgi:hypothetical protein
MASEQLERRYTDQEVALVLQRTAELEERRSRTAAAGRGVTRMELESIARDVGFSVEALDAALRELRGGARVPNQSLLGPALSAKRVAAIPGRLDTADISPLIQLIEDRLATAGTVTEAMGSVRWTSVSTGGNVGPVTQVSFTPGAGETHVQVTRRYPPQTRALLNLLPGFWGGLIGVAIAGGGGLALLPAVAATAGAAGVGLGIGRAIWRRIAKRNHDRVDQITSDLADEARRLGPGPGADSAEA